MAGGVKSASGCGLRMQVRRNAGSPKRLPAGAFCWFNATSLSGYSDGDTLPATLTDLTGTGNDGTRVGSPKYRTARTANDTPVLSPESAGNYYTLPTGMWTGKTAGHLFAYAMAPPVGVEGSGPWQMGASDFTFYAYTTQRNCYEGSLTSTRYAFTADRDLRELWRLYEVEHDGTTYKVRIDGVEQTSQTVGFTAPTSGRVLGTSLTSCNFPIAEVVAYPSALDTDSAAAVRAYLIEQHGPPGTYS